MPDIAEKPEEEKPEPKESVVIRRKKLLNEEKAKDFIKGFEG